ncbi:hypothetical protein GW17_00038871, partial [Ensete ventricosum]
MRSSTAGIGLDPAQRQGAGWVGDVALFCLISPPYVSRPRERPEPAGPRPHPM